MWVGLGDSTVFFQVGCHMFPPPFTEEAYIHLSDVLDSKPPPRFLLLQIVAHLISLYFF
jgi:hypothetical protein